MYPISRSQLTFESGGKQIHIDCYLPDVNLTRLPAIIGLHGSGGGAERMSEPATGCIVGLFVTQGFAVYVLHYFDRTETTSAVDKMTIMRHFFVWAKTVWDAVSFISAQNCVDSNPDRTSGLFAGSLPGPFCRLCQISRVRAVV